MDFTSEIDKTKKLVKKHMIELCEKIGPRPTGSQANKDAVTYAAAEFEKLGLTVGMQEFICMDWQNEGAFLLVDDMSVEAEAAEYSLPC